MVDEDDEGENLQGEEDAVQPAALEPVRGQGTPYGLRDRRNIVAPDRLEL